MKALRIFAAAAVLVALAGCGHAEYYKLMAEHIRVQGELTVKQQEHEIEKTKAEGAKWTAMQAASTTDVGRAVLGVAVAVSEVSKASRSAAPVQPPVFNIPPPKDFMDYVNDGVTVLAKLTNAAATVLAVTEGGKTTRYLADANVRGLEAREAGETARTTGRPPSTSIVVNNQGGDTNMFGSSSNRSDNRDCRSTGGQGGAGSPGGALSIGSLGTGAGALSGFILTPGLGGAGAAGGQAGGNC